MKSSTGQRSGRGKVMRSGSEDKRQWMLQHAAVALARIPGGSMAEISEHMGIARATLYRHFTSRDELIGELAIESLRVIEEVSNKVPSHISSYKDSLCELIRLLIPHGELYYFLMHEPRAMRDASVKTKLEGQYRELELVIEAAKEAGEIDRNLPTPWVSTMFDSVIWSGWWSVHEGKVASNDVGRLAANSFWRSVCAPPSN